MIKNRTAQVVFQSIYCALAVVAFCASLGQFNAKFNDSFYVYYTNLSNYICMVFMFVALVSTIKNANKKQDGYCCVAPSLKFNFMILIMVTLLVYNILLAKDYTAVEYFTSLNNLLMHLILPIMFILDWVLFYEHGKVKWYDPLLCVVLPIIYIIFILIRAAVVQGHNTVVYPYFFLNVDNLGWGGFFTWVCILVVIFVAIGYVIYLLDNIKKFKTKTKSTLN